MSFGIPEKGGSPADIHTVGVIGAGQMGSGIVHICALAGLDVYLSDVDEPALQKGLSVIEGNLGRQVSRGKISEGDKAAALRRIHTGTDYSVFHDCDIVIEA